MTRSLQTVPNRSLPAQDHPRPEAEPAAIPLRRLLSGISRHRFSIATCALLAAGATAAWASLQDATFVAEGSFLIKRGGEEIDVRAFGDERDARNSVGGNVPHLLLSTELLRRVATRLGVDSADQYGAIEDLRSRIEIEVPRRSSLVQVALIDYSPVAARDTLRIYMEEAIEHHLDVYSDDQSIALIEREHSGAVGALAAVQQRFVEFSQETGTTEFAAELEARRAELSAALRARQNFQRETDFASSGEPRLVGLRNQLRSLESRLIELRTKLQPGDQAIVNTERSIEELRQRAQEIAAQHATGLRTSIRERIETESKAVNELVGFEPRFTAINQAMEKAHDHLQRAEIALERARQKTLLAKHQVSALTVLDRPSLPTFDQSTPALVLVIRGLAVGMFLGIALAVLRTMMDQRIREIEDIEKLGAPVLASIPHLQSKHINRHNNSRMIG